MVNNTQEEFEEIVKALTELRRKKNNDYGDGFLKTYNKYGKQAVFFDILRKFQRLENFLLTGKTNEVKDENLEDTFGDIAVMAINNIIWLRQYKKDTKLKKEDNKVELPVIIGNEIIWVKLLKRMFFNGSRPKTNSVSMHEIDKHINFLEKLKLDIENEK